MSRGFRKSGMDPSADKSASPRHPRSALRLFQQAISGASCVRRRLCFSRQARTKSGSAIAMAAWNSFVKQRRTLPPVLSFAPHSRSGSKLSSEARFFLLIPASDPSEFRTARVRYFRFAIRYRGVAGSNVRTPNHQLQSPLCASLQAHRNAGLVSSVAQHDKIAYQKFVLCMIRIQQPPSPTFLSSLPGPFNGVTRTPSVTSTIRFISVGLNRAESPTSSGWA
jgi:hypothetical protein